MRESAALTWLWRSGRNTCSIPSNSFSPTLPVSFFYFPAEQMANGYLGTKQITLHIYFRGVFVQVGVARQHRISHFGGRHRVLDFFILSGHGETLFSTSSFLRSPFVHAFL